MHKDKVDSTAFEPNTQSEPLLYQPYQNAEVPKGMVSIRFSCFTSESACCPCKDDKVILHQHQIVLPEMTTVSSFISIASSKVMASEKFDRCTLNGFELRDSDPIGPTIKSFECFESPVVILRKDEIVEKPCCLLI